MMVPWPTSLVERLAFPLQLTSSAYAGMLVLFWKRPREQLAKTAALIALAIGITKLYQLVVSSRVDFLPNYIAIAPYRVQHLVYIPYPFDAENRHWHSTFVVDITDTIDQKLEAVRAYKSQFDEERFVRVKHMITSANGYHGGRCGFRYGELFALPHPVGSPDLVATVCGSKPTVPPDVSIGKGHLPMG